MQSGQRVPNRSFWQRLSSKGKITAAFLIASTIIMLATPFTSFPYLKYTLMYFISLTIFSASWDLIYSYSGQLSLGHALPYGVSAFYAFVLSLQYGLNPLIAFALAPLFGSAVGGLVGASTIRLRPAYQAIAIFLVSQIFYWGTLSVYGEEGIAPFNPRYGTSQKYPGVDETYFIGVSIFVVSMVVMYALQHSSFRLKLLALKDDPLAARMNGINVTYYKIVVFFIGSFFAGLAGAFTALYTLHVDYSVFQVLTSILPIGVVVFGGPGEIIGSIFGGAVISQLISVLPIWFSQAVTFLVFGFLLVVVLRFYPAGVTGYILKRLERRQQ